LILDKEIAAFDSTTLEEMDRVKLLNRTDTKFLLSESDLKGILSEVKDNYNALEIEGLRLHSYRSLYFDTPDFKFFTEHHNGYPDRYKVRIRKYLDSGLCFLEIKHKKKGRTRKSRIRISDFETELTEQQKQYISLTTGMHWDLRPSLWNEFKRLTLVNKVDEERMTIDLGTHCFIQDREVHFAPAVIAEVKQSSGSRNAPFIKAAKKRLIRPIRISKYCLGMIDLYPELKYNSFKPKKMALDKIKKYA
jgi:hypothetical protein